MFVSMVLAADWAPSIVVLRTRIANSSPPKRATTSPLRTLRRSSSATLRIRRSPAWCPHESLMYLNWSRSTNSTALVCPLRMTAIVSFLSSSTKRRRLNRPVRLSWLAISTSLASRSLRAVAVVSSASTISEISRCSAGLNLTARLPLASSWIGACSSEMDDNARRSARRPKNARMKIRTTRITTAPLMLASRRLWKIMKSR